MDKLIKINNKDLAVKELEGKRVVTFKDIDNLHERTEGTARKRFYDNRDKFIEEVDYFNVSLKSEKQTLGIEVPNRGIIVITESGYLMIVKSLTDDLAWKVQRQLVDSYFRVNELKESLNELSPQLQALINMELRQVELETAVTETKEQITTIKDTMAVKTKDWRSWVNNRMRKIGASKGNFRLAYSESYEELENRARCDLNRRVINKRGRMFKAGASNSAMKKVGNLDVIEEDKQLKEIYTTIIKEMCIKYL